MKQLVIISWMLVFVFSALNSSFGAPRIYKWVKDKRESSDEVLSKSQSSRVLPISETQTLELIRLTMKDDLYMALGEYHKTKHRQEAETTTDTVLPEAIIRTAEIDMIDEDYLFVLEVSMKKYGDRTRVMAKASPVYRVRDYDAEAAAGSEDSGGQTVEVKIKSDQGGGIAMGPIVVAPIYGVPSDYGAQPIPGAAKRASQLVRSFMYFLDKRMSVNHGRREASPDSGQHSDQVMSQPQGRSEVDIKVKSK
jgi:hypothetical protein